MHQMVDMLDPQKMARTFFNLAKDYTETALKTMKTSSEVYEKSLEVMIKQGMVGQSEGQKLLADWMDKAKQGQQQYWDTMADSIKKMEKLFGSDTGKKS